MGCNSSKNLGDDERKGNQHQNQVIHSTPAPGTRPASASPSELRQKKIKEEKEVEARAKEEYQKNAWWMHVGKDVEKDPSYCRRCQEQVTDPDTGLEAMDRK